MSFAKVAASITTENRHSNSPRPPTITMKENSRNTFSNTQATGPIFASGERNMAPLLDTQQPHPLKSLGLPGQEPTVDSLAHSLNDFSVGPNARNIVVKTGNTSLEPDQPASRGSGSEDSQKADSSSELGTKPPSLDGKSITSGTTFALDEKESLRPDDSASVKAAGEDDDAFSIRGSLIAGSRMSSDLAGRARPIQLGDMPERRLMHVTSGGSSHGILTPQSTSSEQQLGNAPGMPELERADSSSDALGLIYQHAPDDKLIEAMASAKDRLFLLKLEKEVIDFVQNSKEPYMDFPPSNSFCRMLTHKLADYYHMTHSFEPNIGSVRIFRTPFCRVPTSLAQWDAAPEPPSSTPPPVILPKKIMRRGQDGIMGTASTSPSKPTSEAGSEAKDGKERQLGIQTRTREQREEEYKLARERIFGTSEETIPADTEGDNGMSRTSSVSTNNRSNLGKKGKAGRQRRDDSDSFDSRNHYTPYWGSQQPTWVQQTPPAQGNQFMPAQYAQIYQQGPAGYMNQPVPGAMPAMPPMVPKQNHMMYQNPQYPQPQPQPQRLPPAGGSPMAPQVVPMQAQGNVQQQVWQPGFTPTYQTRGGTPAGPQSQMGVHPQSGVPYAFGQLPANANPYDPKTQHPIPGSYNRNHTFNPMTQSFIPGGNRMQPVNAPQPPFTAPASHHGSPQAGSPHLAFPQYQQGLPQAYGSSYGMIRQGSNSSLPGYHPPQHMPSPYGHHSHQPAPNLHHNPVQQMPIHPPPHLNQPNVPQHVHQHVPQMFPHLPTYGNPATLPQKPATGP